MDQDVRGAEDVDDGVAPEPPLVLDGSPAKVVLLQAPQKQRARGKRMGGARECLWRLRVTSEGRKRLEGRAMQNPRDGTRVGEMRERREGRERVKVDVPRVKERGTGKRGPGGSCN